MAKAVPARTGWAPVVLNDYAVMEIPLGARSALGPGPVLRPRLTANIWAAFCGIAQKPPTLRTGRVPPPPRAHCPETRARKLPSGQRISPIFQPSLE